MRQRLLVEAPERADATEGVEASSPRQPSIPVLDVGPDFPLATLRAERARAHALLDLATEGYPRAALARLDQVSRRWLVKHANTHLAEIDAIAELLGRPGGYFLSVNYEWGCTVGVKSCPESRSARLVRVLDWKTKGLGRHVIAARVAGPSGRFVTLTWPGYTGVLQACAPGRFAAALNQAPLPRRGGLVFPFDWAISKARVWRMPHPTAAHLLRDVFEQASDFDTARRMLMSRPIAAPAIYSLAGIEAGQSCVIERLETEARVIDGAAVAANHWQAADWRGRPRGIDSHGRRLQMRDAVSADFDAAFAWLKPPILNPRTRLVMIAEPRTGRLLARGYEVDGPATSPLDMIA